MYVNVWVAIEDGAKDLLVERLQWDEETDGTYTGPVDPIEYKIFSRMSDRASVQKLFKTPTIGGKVWHLFSLYLDGTAKAKEALDWMEANRPGFFAVVGAWYYSSGEQVRNNEGEIIYPIHPRVIDFMSDTPIFDENGDITGYAPGTVRDINLLQGQAKRDFSG